MAETNRSCDKDLGKKEKLTFLEDFYHNPFSRLASMSAIEPNL